MAKVLIVEDEMLVAAHLEDMLTDLGYTPVGIAPDSAAALRLALQQPDLALVDVNLRDGPTGPMIGAKLAQEGIGVVFVTANPRELGDGVPGTFGALSKPCDQAKIASVLDYAKLRKQGASPPAPPSIKVFE